MTHPTLRTLVSGLKRDLIPVPGFQVTDAEVSAVHVSELADPTLFLSGGELLLTTGLALPTDTADCTAYISRLVHAGVVGLGFGIGAVYDEVPAVLIQACRTAGMPLLVVQTTFLAISRAYWTTIARAGEQVLLDQLAYQRALVDAAGTQDPTQTVLRILASSVGGWAAVFSATGQLNRVHPEASSEQAADLSPDLAKIRSNPGAATFIVEGRSVVTFPLTTAGRTLGFVAVGADGQITPAERQTVLTAASLLVLLASHESAHQRGEVVARACVATLLDLGLPDAAARLSNAVGAPPVVQRVRVLAVRSADLNGITEAIEGWCDQALGATVDRETAWYAVPAGARAPDDLAALLLAVDPAVKASLSEPVRVQDLAGARVREISAMSLLQPGETALSTPLPVSPLAVQRGLKKLHAEGSGDVIDAVVSYLGNRGHWEAAARQLGVHRNTLRYRIQRACAITGLDLDDPDVAAYLWLSLRDRGTS